MRPTHAEDDVVLWQEGHGLRYSELARQVGALARALPNCRYSINICDRRRHFLVAFLAAAVRGQINLLPSNRSPVALREIQEAHNDSGLLTDEGVEAVLKEAGSSMPPVDLSSAIPPEREVAIVFTSGSTGRPEGHIKHWRTLVVMAQLMRQRLLSDQRYNMVVTVPSQHMYGLETSVILTLVSGSAVSDSRPFFPGDVARELALVPEPRMWITTPTHLRACVLAGVALPQLSLILSATAPLERELAQAAEELWHAPVYEIYGCTEAGSLASRRTVESASWQLYSNVRLESVGTETFVSGPHLPAAVQLQDRIELDGAQHFRLLGRCADLIKVAGKRASLNELTQRLLQVSGVVDGIMFVPRDDARPAALVVAPQLDRETVLAQLAERIDSAFLPRPLVLLDALPRNDAGKLPRAALLSAIGYDAQSSVVIDADAPCLEGHFSGNPIVPGVVILEEVLKELSRRTASQVLLRAVPAVKFLSPLRPGERLQIDITVPAAGFVAPLRFQCRVGERAVAEGLMQVKQAREP